MILLQLSSGQGPSESQRAVALAFRRLEQECERSSVRCQVVQAINGRQNGTYKSILLELRGAQAQSLANQWQGSHQWICPSPYRPRIKRKNWFFGGELFAIESTSMDTSAIRFKSCRASGAGGQHVNTTDSAIQATHIESGIQVRVETERSQHANKRLAMLLIQQKLVQISQDATAKSKESHWKQHYQLVRGQANRVFEGSEFNEI